MSELVDYPNIYVSSGNNSVSHIDVLGLHLVKGMPHKHVFKDGTESDWHVHPDDWEDFNDPNPPINLEEEEGECCRSYAEAVKEWVDFTYANFWGNVPGVPGGTSELIGGSELAAKAYFIKHINQANMALAECEAKAAREKKNPEECCAKEKAWRDKLYEGLNNGIR